MRHRPDECELPGLNHLNSHLLNAIRQHRVVARARRHECEVHYECHYGSDERNDREGALEGGNSQGLCVCLGGVCDRKGFRHGRHLNHYVQERGDTHGNGGRTHGCFTRDAGREHALHHRRVQFVPFAMLRGTPRRGLLVLRAAVFAILNPASEYRHHPRDSQQQNCGSCERPHTHREVLLGSRAIARQTGKEDNGAVGDGTEHRKHDGAH
mmetsp:Transcript_3661/g.9218  ORF Transcript_3661/g.9218 Transcript_3661/m.9218 type:complete len:211 (+) Transcript_3661:1327-1959(+)